MAWLFPFLFLAWPAAEIFVLIEVAGWLGWPAAIAGLVLSGVAGMALLRTQGLATARQVQDQMNRGEMPVDALFDGACLALAGGLLMIPGYITCLLGLGLLAPPARGGLRRLLGSRFTATADASRGPSSGQTVIDGEWTVVDGGDSPPAEPRDRLPKD